MATILDGLNAISQAVGGTGEAESNLEALNQISEALGGSANATENAEAIANIAENASGGGGGTIISFSLTNETGNNIEFASLVGENGQDQIDHNAFETWHFNSGTETIILPAIDGKAKMVLPIAIGKTYTLSTGTPESMYLEGPGSRVLVVTQSGVSGTVKFV